MIVSLDKYLPSKGKLQIVRIGEEIIRNLGKHMFDVLVVGLTEADVEILL